MNKTHNPVSLLATLTAGAALLMTPLASATAAAIATIDKDNDGKISQAEFAASSKPHLSTADDDQDGYISNTEMVEATFRAWDKDGNGEIIPAEFHSGLDTMAERNAKQIKFEIWDQNNDNEVHMDEFKEGLKTTGLYTAVYTAPTVRPAVVDFQNSVFTYYDLDRDGYLSATEIPNGTLYVTY